jgi:hypothetical protein
MLAHCEDQDDPASPSISIALLPQLTGKETARPSPPQPAPPHSFASTTAPPHPRARTQHRLPLLYNLRTLGQPLGQGRGRIAQSNLCGAELRHGRRHCELTADVLFRPPLSVVSVRNSAGLPLALGVTLPWDVASPERNMTTTVAALTAPHHRARGQLGCRTSTEPSLALLVTHGRSAAVAALVESVWHLRSPACRRTAPPSAIAGGGSFPANPRKPVAPTSVRNLALNTSVSSISPAG